MYYTGIDPFTGQAVYLARNLSDRKLQRGLLQFFKPENYFEVREAPWKAGRGELIGSNCECLISAQPPKAAPRARMLCTNRALGEGRYVHTIEEQGGRAEFFGTRPGRQVTSGYRPGRKRARRRRR
jgi:hypothetical protein